MISPTFQASISVCGRSGRPDTDHLLRRRRLGVLRGRSHSRADCRRRSRRQEPATVYPLRESSKDWRSHHPLLDLAHGGWRIPLNLPWNGRIPLNVETTLPRERQVGEDASPHLDASRIIYRTNGSSRRTMFPKAAAPCRRPWRQLASAADARRITQSRFSRRSPDPSRAPSRASHR